MQLRPVADQALGAGGQRSAQELERLGRKHRDLPAVAHVEVGDPGSVKNIGIAMPWKRPTVARGANFVAGDYLLR
jgi:hypothetical protein